MRMVKRLFICLSAIFMAALFLFSGCVRNTGDAVGEDKTMELIWVLLGPGEQADSQMVWDEFNEKLQEYLPNTNVSFKVYPSAEFSEKWKLMVASKEKIDLMWVGYAIDTLTEVRRGAFLPLDDLLDKYGQDTKAELPSMLFDCVKIDGKLYEVPNYQMMFGGIEGLRTHKELSDQYWDVEKAERVFFDDKTMSEASYAVIEEYLENLKNAGKLGTGVDPIYMDRIRGKNYVTVFYDYFCRQRDDDNYTVYNGFELPESKLYFSKMSEWYQKGYIRKDILSVQNPDQENGKKDGNILWSHGYFTNSETTDTARYGFPIKVVPMNEEYYNDWTGSATGTAIPISSQYPEQAMKLIDLMNTKKGKDLYNMLTFGIEGKHYEKLEGNRIKTLSYEASANGNSTYGLFRWTIGNTFNSYENQGDPEGWNDYVKTNNEAGEPSKLVGFKFDDSNVKLEMQRFDSVVKEYKKALGSGAVPNHNEYYDEMIGKMKTAGSDKIVEELQKQIDAFLVAKGLK